MKTQAKRLVKGMIEAEIQGLKVSICDNSRNIEVLYDYPWHQTEESALEFCIWQYEEKRKGIK